MLVLSDYHIVNGRAFVSRVHLGLWSKPASPKYVRCTMDNDNLPYGGDEDTIAPDLVAQDKQPVDPATAIRREEEKYAESSLNENREDQFDVHHADVDDIV